MSEARFKIIVSDMHLGKGRALPDGTINPLEEFYYGEKFIEFLNYYSSGEYRDAEVELVINGDFLNFLQVDYHGHFLSVITESVAIVVLKSIIEGNKKVFEMMRRFAAMPGKSITYIVGNHDQAMLWPGTREFLDETIGHSIKYKNLVYFFDGVHIEHGHMHEAANRFDTRRFFLKKDLPEPILNLPFGSHFFIDFVLKVKQKYPHIDKVRPFKRLIRWTLLNETWFTIKTMTKLFGYLIKSIFRRDPTRQVSFKRVVEILFESAIFPDLSESARLILNDPKVHTVIFGHSHVYKYRQWGQNKQYFNTGTWTELTSLDIPNIGLITKLTYVLIDYDQDRPRSRLKEWKGFHRIEEDVVVS